jgi:hypothetical protein
VSEEIVQFWSAVLSPQRSSAHPIPTNVVA